MFASQTVSRFVIGTLGTTFCATVCLLGATAPAHADTVSGAQTKTVGYSDLNLGSAEGRAVLDRRIRNAARSVCGTPDATLADRARNARCVRTAIDGALPQVATAKSAGSIG